LQDLDTSDRLICLRDVGSGLRVGQQTVEVVIAAHERRWLRGGVLGHGFSS
jgi:hypothetical protein